MTWEWWELAGPAVLALVLLVALARMRSRTRRELAAARAEAAELRERLERLERLEQAAPAALPIRTTQEFTITRVGTGEPDADHEPTALEPAVFTDLLLRESVIRLGSLAHGVRRALAPETRNRIRFEMRRELRRSRRQRRVEQREAWREWQARQRQRVPDDRLRDTA